MMVYVSNGPGDMAPVIATRKENENTSQNEENKSVISHFRISEIAHMRTGEKFSIALRRSDFAGKNWNHVFKLSIDKW